MALADFDLARRNIKGSLACLLLTVVTSLHPESAGAQLCGGNIYQGCTNPGAACKAPGVPDGLCTNVPGLPSGERECACSPRSPTPAQPSAAWCQASNICPINAPLADHLFYIHDFGHRCIDAGLPQSWTQGAPVFINACNGTAGQQIRVKEIDGTHDVALSVEPPRLTNAPVSDRLTVGGPTNVGFCIGVHDGTVAASATLELQTCNASSPSQRFAVDGDAILMGSQTAGKVTRDFVIERQNGSTVQQTPLVVVTRDLWEEEPLRIDARYFRFDAVDGSGASLTSGFLTVADETHLVCAAQCGWGTVVQIDDHQPLALTQLSSIINVVDGTTIRGYRSKTYQGPEIQTCVDPNGIDWPAFQTTGRAVRFTGLRLHGPNADSRCWPVIENHSANQNGIQVIPSDNPSLPLPSVWLDHLEVSFWPASGILVGDPGFVGDPNAKPIPCDTCPYPETPEARVIANVIHDNVYGSNTNGGKFTHNRANVFYGNLNQPVTVREMSCNGGYAAMDNLFLSESSEVSSDDVDMHGSLNPGHWYGGVVGEYFDVGSNTFLLKDKDNFVANVNQRGASCRFTMVHDNVFLRSAGDAIHDPYTPAPLISYNNSFDAQDPTLGPLLVGDFDGDGIDDVFLATGAAWYYSSGGQTEWRYLNRASEGATALLVGDFDADGRADVMTLHGSNIDVSWAGVSAWQTINSTTSPLSDLAVGDFDGDGRSDLLLATGTEWFFASGGQKWVPFAAYTDRISDLRFGHFTDKSKTQILRVRNHRWQITEWGMTSWTDIGEAPTDSVSDLVAGDFDGDGFTDLMQSIAILLGRHLPRYQWTYTSPGHGSSWSVFGTYFGPIADLPIGRFEGGGQTGVITWGNNSFYYTHGVGAQHVSQPLSTQVMR